MSHILIVDDDATLRETLARAARSWGFEASVAKSAESALLSLEQMQIDVLVTDLRMGGQDGIDLIRKAAQSSPDTQTVLMSAYATAKQQQLATEHGTVVVLCKPFTPSDLRGALSQALDSRKGYHGTVHGLSLVDMLQMFHLARRSVSIQIGGSLPGEIHFMDGELIHASCGDSSGEPALTALLGADSGSIATTAPSRLERTIETSFDALLMDAMRRIDEQAHTSDIPDSNFDAAFASCPPPEGDDDDFTALPVALRMPPPEDELGKTTDITSASPEPRPTSHEQDPAPLPEAPTVQTTPTVESTPPPPVRPQREPHARSEMDSACKAIVENVDGGVACGVVDLRNGALLGMFSSAGGSAALNDIVAAACLDMFRGGNAVRAHRAIRQHRNAPEDGANYFEEIHIRSTHNLHFMKAVKNGQAAITLVTARTTNVAIGWASLKAQIGTIEPLVL